MSAEILRADPALRRRALIRLAILTVAGAIAIGWILPIVIAALQDAKLAGTVGARTICYAFLAFLGVLALLVANLGRRIARDGRRIVSLQQFPLPDAEVLRDTRILRGDAARRIGAANVFLGNALVVCAVALLSLSGYAVFQIARL